MINTLTVTYPAVVGEVNPVDFIALEALRVFLPDVYHIVRDNPDKFAGHSADHYRRDEDDERQTFRKALLEKMPEDLRSSTFELLRRVFPKLDQTSYGADWLGEWRKKLRACHPDLWPTYFRLSLPPNTVSNSEVKALLSAADNRDSLAATLISGTQAKIANGLSRTRVLLERLMDFVRKDIPVDRIPIFSDVLLNIGDRFSSENDKLGAFDTSNELRVSRIVYHLLRRVSLEERGAILSRAFTDGEAIGVQRYLLTALIDELAKEHPGSDGPLVDDKTSKELKRLWLWKVQRQRNTLLQHPELARILYAWREWGDTSEVRAWCAQCISSDDGLFSFLLKFVSYVRSQTFGDRAVTKRLRLNPAWIEPYVDIEECMKRLRRLKTAGRVPGTAKEAAAQFMTEFEMLKAGKNSGRD